jgi:ATP-dependent Zn protease
MSVLISENELPMELTTEGAVEAAYSAELAEIASKLQRGLPTLVECDKDLGPYLYLNLRNRLRAVNLRCLYLDGRPNPNQPEGPMPQGMIGTMISQLRDAVRGAVERRVIVLPHLDLLTTSQGGLTAEAREVIPLLYENPELVWLGFKDPSFPLPKVIENLFTYQTSLLGISRTRLRYLVTKKESRKFGREFNPWALYKHVSGVNAARLRKLLSTLEGEDYPASPHLAYRQLRQATLGGTLEMPNISLDKDIGGYAKVKERLRNEILDVLRRKEALTNEEQIKAMEELIPKGMIFWGPPGTGKTLFAKAIASEIGAAIQVVSGPELKSKWVGESLPFDEEVFVILNGEARRMPIGELVEQHANEVVETWTVCDNGSALLAPVTGFLKHKGPDYIDVLVTETGREVRVTGGHSLFIEQDGRLAEVFAEQVELGKTRIAVPLALQAPETVRELNLLELLGGREDVRVEGYGDILTQAVEQLGEEQVEQKVGVALARLRGAHQRSPLTLAAFHRLVAAAGVFPDVSRLVLACWTRRNMIPAVLPLTEDLAEFLGVWTADGCFHRTGVRLATNADDVDYYEALCRRLFGHVTRYPKKGENARGIDLVINHTLLRRVMMDGLKLRDGSGRKRVPAVIFLAPLPIVAAFLRGYFSGDGTFSGKYIEASTVSRGLANDVMTLLQYFGIAARCRTKKEWSGSVSNRVRFLWTGFLRVFAEKIGFADERRQCALIDYLDEIKLQRDVQTPACHITNDVLWDLVVDKRREPYEREHVYDLSVPKTERFIAGFGNVLVHNSEDNLRQIFHKARQSAPSIIVFDEIDSFASARGTYTGSGVEHSMVNQLLTEMDGFHKEEMVFIVGTTNFVESLDQALLRPGRFEFHLHIPYPDGDGRREILRIYDKKMALKMTPETLDYAVKRTDYLVPGAAAGTLFSGDHLNALCRSIARRRLRANRTDETTPLDIDQALTEWVEPANLTPHEEVVVATHEAGHAVCALFTPDARAIERIALADDVVGALGYVRHQETKHRNVRMRKQMLADLTVLMGGREAELLFFNDLTWGASQDLMQATAMARDMVEVFGMGGEDIGVTRYRALDSDHKRHADLSPAQLEALDRRIHQLLEDARRQAAAILRENRAIVEMLRDELVAKKVIEAATLKEMLAAKTGDDEKKPRKGKAKAESV